MRLARFAAVWLLVGAGCAVLGGGPAQYRQWQDLTAELRDLPFSRLDPPGFRWIEQHEIPDLLRTDLEETLEPGYVDAYEASFKALGFLPGNIDLIESMLVLQQDQVVGFYSPDDDVMHVRSDLPEGADDIDMIVVHELVHALQARHFPQLMALMRDLRRNDDVISALAAAVEGDASLTMLGLPNTGLAMRRDLASAEIWRSAQLSDLEHPSGIFGNAPRLLQHSILFPYAHGMVLAAREYEQTGNAGLDALLRDPPLATARVYDDDSSAPVEFLRLPTDALTLENCSLGHDNVAGALALRSLFDEHLPHADRAQVEDLLYSWSGDRFVHVPCTDRTEFAWVTRWSDPGHARTFATLYAVAAPRIAEYAHLPGPPTAHADDRTVVVVTGGLIGAVDRLQQETETRAYSSLEEWLADDCFPESPCPD